MTRSPAVTSQTAPQPGKGIGPTRPHRPARRKARSSSVHPSELPCHGIPAPDRPLGFFRGLLFAIPASLILWGLLFLLYRAVAA
jgi:hypothetical protein